MKHIVYKNKSRNHKSKINSYEASFKEIEGKEIRFNYKDWIYDPETKVAILIKTKESDSLLKEKTQTLNNLTPIEYFDSNFVEAIPGKHLRNLKDSEIRNNDQVCNHSIIKLYNSEFIGYFTVTKGKIMKALIYETNENDQYTIYELTFAKNIIESDLDIFGLGQVYTNQENGNILNKFYLDSSLFMEVKLDPQEFVVLNKYQKERVDDFKHKLDNKNPTTFVAEIRKELATHKIILLNGAMCHTDKEILLAPYEIDLKSKVNNEEIIDILKDKLD